MCHSYCAVQVLHIMGNSEKKILSVTDNRGQIHNYKTTQLKETQRERRINTLFVLLLAFQLLLASSLGIFLCYAPVKEEEQTYFFFPQPTHFKLRGQKIAKKSNKSARDKLRQN